MAQHELLTHLFETAVAAVRGDAAVSRAIADIDMTPPDQIIAVGKAASAMAAAAHAVYPHAPLLIVTKYGHAEDAPPAAQVIEAAHPVLDSNSLLAGSRLLETVAGMHAESHLLMLVSGGASALAEAPIDGLDLEGLKKRTTEMLGSGADIHAMNKVRKTLSRIKGGKLLATFGGAQVTTLAISDVEGDALSVIGSGIADAPKDAAFGFAPYIVASNAIARDAVARAAQAMDIPLQTNDETLYDDIEALGVRLAKALVAGPPGLHLWGGEPTVVLPENPGQGGRNQALGLIIAREIAGQSGISVLVAGTDGTDGPTDAAGALVDTSTWQTSANDALAGADAGRWLERHSALLKTGPTGTNVMDLVIALKS